MSTLWDPWQLLQGMAQMALTMLAFVVEFAKQHPVETGLTVLALLRLFGTTVQSGYKGVLFVFGRVRKELEPGFHPLLPVILAVRKIPVRSITLDLPKQRLTTADGMVYDVQANIVYRVVDPKLALTQIDYLRKGIEAVLPLVLAELLRDQTRAAAREFKALEAEFLARAENKLRRWGVTIEQAGFKNISPTKKTLRLTQLALLAGERQRVLSDLVSAGLAPTAAVALLGAERRLVGHASARYRALHRHAHLAPAAADKLLRPPLLPGEELETQPLSPAQEPGVEEAVAAEASGQPDGVTAQKRPRLWKKTTKGVQPRSWLRYKWRLRRRRATPALLPAGPQVPGGEKQKEEQVWR
jgi:regulator of protease activity HflC (stomatin/prohibitin superfamily)